jgi:hypothetical protein
LAGAVCADRSDNEFAAEDAFSPRTELLEAFSALWSLLNRA